MPDNFHDKILCFPQKKPELAEDPLDFRCYKKKDNAPLVPQCGVRDGRNVLSFIMKTHFSFSLLVLVLISCEDDNKSECNVIRAKSGYSIVTPTTYDDEYLYTFAGGKLAKIECLDIDTKETISITELDYDVEDKVSLETTTYSGGITYRYYNYEPTSITTTTYTIVESDTSSVLEEQHFYVENPEDKVYHHAANKSSLKFQNGNLIEYGYYEVSGTDTTDTFYELYSYDNHANYYNLPEYRIIIPSDFIWAKVASKNNLVRAQYDGGGWDVSYTYSYNENDGLIQYVGKSGITIEFEYNCR